MTDDSGGNQAREDGASPLEIDERLRALEVFVGMPPAARPQSYYKELHDRVQRLEAKLPVMDATQRFRLYTVKTQYFIDIGVDTYNKFNNAETTGHDLIVKAGRAAVHAYTEARASGDRMATARALRLIAQILRRLVLFPACAAAYRACIVLLLRAGAVAGEDAELAHELLDAQVRLVSIEIMLGNTTAAQRRLNRAVELARRINARHSGKADLDLQTINWLQALISRMDDHLVEALESATQAADAYLRQGPSISQVRVLWVTTEIALDLAERHPSARDEHLTMAERYHRLTREQAEKVKDRSGMEMAVLSEARLRQLKKADTLLAVSQPQLVLKHMRSKRKWDAALAIDAYVTLGRTLLARDERTAAQSAFERAVDEALKSGSPGMAWYAARALISPPFATPAPAIVV